MEKTRLRIRFTKTGDLRWIGHLDLARAWERMLRRANLRLAFSEGFHPKPRINFPSALALGVEALDEVVELEVLGEVDVDFVEEGIRREMPAGMELLSIKSLSLSEGKVKVLGSTYRIRLHPSQVESVEKKILEALQSGAITAQREKKVVTCDTQNEGFQLKVDGDHLSFTLPTVAQASIRPSELLEYLGVASLLEDGEILQRVAVETQQPAEAYTQEN